MPARTEIRALTGLRAVAAWTVVLYHISNDMPVPAAIHALFTEGEYAVDLFFVMSGLVLARSYGALFQHPAPIRTFLRFLGFRLARIYPLHFAVLVLYLAIPLAFALTGRARPPGRYEWGYYVESLFLVQNWGFAHAHDWNKPAWSISSEALFYLAFPFIALLVGRAARSRAGLMAAGLALLIGLALFGAYNGRLMAYTVRFGPLRCLFECSIGMALFHVTTAWPPSRRAGTLLLAAAILLAACFPMGLLPDYIAIPAAIVALLWSLLAPANPLAALLGSPIPHWLGRLSVATYLVHYLVKDATRLLIEGRVPVAVLVPVYILGVLAASIVLHAFVERPGQRLGRRLTEALTGPLPIPARGLTI